VSLREGNDAESHHKLGRVLYEMGVLQEARAELETAIRQREGGEMFKRPPTQRVGTDTRGIGKRKKGDKATRLIGQPELPEVATHKMTGSGTQIINDEFLTTYTDTSTEPLGTPPDDERRPLNRETQQWTGDASGAAANTDDQAQTTLLAGDNRPTMRMTDGPLQAFPEAHLDLGRVLYDLGQSQQAIQEFRTAIEQRGGLFPRAHYELGRALVRAGRHSEAMSELQQAIEQQGGTFPEAHFQTGQLLARQGESESAIDSYQMAIKQSGGVYPEAYYYMGNANVRSRNPEAAVTAYRQAIAQRGGNYPEAHQDLGRALYSMGNLEAANEEYSIAVRQRSPQKTGDLGASRGGQTATLESEHARREAIVGELGASLRQAPAAPDAAKSKSGTRGATEELVSNYESLDRKSVV